MCHGRISRFFKCRHLRDVVVTKQCHRHRGTDYFCGYDTPSFFTSNIHSPTLCEQCYRDKEDAIRTKHYKQINILYDDIAHLRSCAHDHYRRDLVIRQSILAAQQKIEHYEHLARDALALFRALQGGKYIGNGVWLSANPDADPKEMTSPRGPRVYWVGNRSSRKGPDVVAFLETLVPSTLPLPLSSTYLDRKHSTKLQRVQYMENPQDLSAAGKTCTEKCRNVSTSPGPLCSHPVCPADLDIEQAVHARSMKAFSRPILDTSAKRSSAKSAKSAQSPRKAVLRRNLSKEVDERPNTASSHFNGVIGPDRVPIPIIVTPPPLTRTDSTSTLGTGAPRTDTETFTPPPPSPASPTPPPSPTLSHISAPTIKPITDSHQRSLPPHLILARERQRLQSRVRRFVQHGDWSAAWGPRPKFNNAKFRYGVVYPLHPSIGHVPISNYDLPVSERYKYSPLYENQSTSSSSSSSFLKVQKSPRSLDLARHVPTGSCKGNVFSSSNSSSLSSDISPSSSSLSSSTSSPSLRSSPVLSRFSSYPSSPPADPSPLAQTLAREARNGQRLCFPKPTSTNPGLGLGLGLKGSNILKPDELKPTHNAVSRRQCKQMFILEYDDEDEDEDEDVDIDGELGDVGGYDDLKTAEAIERPEHVDGVY